MDERENDSGLLPDEVQDIVREAAANAEPFAEPDPAIVNSLLSEVNFRLTKDMKDAAERMPPMIARFIVKYYYKMQKFRKSEDNQILAAQKANQPYDLLAALSTMHHKTENWLKGLFKAYVEHHPVGAWMIEQIGIGPVLSAGYLAHIDIDKAPTSGHIMSFAGLVGRKWEKGQKRPWNAALKTLTWLTGQCFTKTKNHQEAYYGKFIDKCLEKEVALNEAGYFKDAAAEWAARVGKETKVYPVYITGKLPLVHLRSRAQRYASKLFISHLHRVWFAWRHGKDAPRPWIMEFGKQRGLGEHTHFITNDSVDSKVAEFISMRARVAYEAGRNGVAGQTTR